MAIYKCEVINEKGKTKTRKINAIDEVDLKVQLKDSGMVLVKYKLIPEKKYSSFFTWSLSVKRAEVVIFLRQFAVMVVSSIPVDEALSALRLQNFTKGMKQKIAKVYSDVVSGVTLSEAFRFHKDIFPPFFCNMLQIGELSGSLDIVLDSIADYYENDEKIKKKAKTSMIYPIILIFMIFAITLFMSFFILPKFAEIFEEFGSEIPEITRIVLGIAAFVRNYIFIIIGGIVLIVLLFVIFFMTKKGKYVKDWLSIHIPIIGKINRAIITARFSRAFAILLKSGMNLTTCLENLINILGNRVYQKSFRKVIDNVKRGKTIANSMEEEKIFNKLLTQMIRIGEKSGNLEGVLDSTTGFFDTQVDTDINKAISLMEPIVIIILGVVVAVVLLSIYIPMIQLMNAI